MELAFRSGQWRRGGRIAAAVSWSALVVAGLCSACTVVEIHAGEDQVHVERHLGFVSLEFPPATTSRVVQLTGLGLVSVGFETTVGYADAMVVTLGNDCRLLVWIDDQDQIDHLNSLIPDTNSLCIATEQGLKGRNS